jgi:XRE family transcriptional regulator, regulator of sulfur utilization
MAAISPRHRAFGAAVRTLRQERGWTQDTLAERANMSENYVGDTERGERNISIRVLWQLADGLGIAASELLRTAEQSKAKPRA